ncbi:ATP-binding cassette domain-containing protein [Alphaproteobacteria bacterium]|nr:ATP-binding cassette domain-containing protein [Alphaproteobacteria bacterium]
MSPPILTLKNIHLTFGGTPLLEGAEISVSKGDRICLVGRNGSGKSTLLKIAAGIDKPDDGERFVQPGTSLSYLPQEPNFEGYKTISDYVLADLNIEDSPERANWLIKQFNLNPNERLSNLSGGEARRCALARSLAPEPDILLLDEPTNHLDLPIIEWLESELNNIRSALVLISHDRRFLQNLSRSTIWINQGVTHKLNKSFINFESWREDFIENEIIKRHKLDRKLVTETEWLNQGVSGRRKRNMGRLKALKDLRVKRKNDRPVSSNIDMVANKVEISGKRVSLVKNISKSYEDKNLIDNFSTIIQRRDRIGIIGSNGSGKTTLLNILIGKTEPDKGVVYLGKNLDIQILDQKRDSLDNNMTLANALTGGGDTVEINGVSKHVIGYMKSFLFSPEQARTPLKVLSGGERGRIMLARALAKSSNFLILDEPTNDLDIETLDLLQELLSDYQGTVILVSHDRDFLDRVVTSVIAYEGQGKWIEYAGGYSDMLDQKNKKINLMKDLEKKESKINNKNNSTSIPRLTYKDKYALETLPKVIEKYIVEIKIQNDILSEPNLYASNPDLFNLTSKKLKNIDSDLKKAEQKWLELEIKSETLKSEKINDN